METRSDRTNHLDEWLSTVLDPDVFAVQEEADMYVVRDEIDELIESVQRELSAEARAEERRISRAFNDEVRAHRARRRAERTALRALPVRVVSASEFGEVAA